MEDEDGSSSSSSSSSLSSSSDPLSHNPSKKLKTTPKIDEQTLINLPPEIITEILIRLPVKSLLKFRCVSKSWLSLISTSNFIKAHFKNSTQNPNLTNHRLMFSISRPHFDLMQCSVSSLMSEQFTVVDKVDYPNKNHDSAVWVVGSCNGLICLAFDEKDVLLWNPCLKISKKLPPVDVPMKQGFYYMWGFGYSESDDDYKVVGLFCVFENGGTHESIVKVYSLRSDSWRRIEDFKGGVPLNDSGKFASGRLHFPASVNGSFKWDIVSLDLGSEVYGVVEQPDYVEGCYDSALGVLDGCISVLCNYQDSRAEVWVLKEYGVKESWARFVVIPYVDDPGRILYSNPLCVLPNGEILLAFGTDLLVYNPKDNCFRSPKMSNLDSFLAVDIYVESLVSLEMEG